MIIDFVKMQAAGNDYIYVDCDKFVFRNASSVAKNLSRRRYSVGSDGLVLMEKSDVADVKMIIYNADGSRALTCGNALRCVALYMAERKNFSRGEITVETDSGVKSVKVSESCDGCREFTVDMGKATFVNEYGTLITDVGNLHRVELCDDTKTADFSLIGDMRPDVYNTELVKIISPGTVAARVFERGSGETQACGSGACAIAAYCVYRKIFGFGKVRVIYPGGTLYAEVKEDYGVSLTGDAHFVYDGRTEI